MLHRPTLAVPLVLALLLPACASRPFDRSTEPGGRALGMTSAGTVVITGDALAGDATLTLLDAIRRAMPHMRTAPGPDPNRCPIIELRGKDSIHGSSNPEVYVDGTRTLDTCPLSTIQAMQASRNEVYPLGVTSRGGYMSSPHGLILIFLQRAGGAETSGAE
jgi:hypothetical protein